MATSNIEFKFTGDTTELDKKFKESVEKMQRYQKLANEYSSRAGGGDQNAQRLQKIFEDNLKKSTADLKKLETDLDAKIKRAEQLLLSAKSESTKNLLSKSIEENQRTLGQVKGISSPISPTDSTSEKQSLLKSFIQQVGIQAITRAISDSVSTVVRREDIILSQQAGVVSNFRNAMGMELGSSPVEAMFNLDKTYKGMEAGERAVNASVRGSGIAGLGGAFGGAIAGSAFGPVGALATFAGSYLANGRNRAGLTGLLTGDYSGSLERYDANTFIEGMRESVSSQKAVDAYRQKAFGFLDSNRDRFSTIENTLGLSDRDILRNLDSDSSGLFSIQDKMRNSQSMIQAGGSSALGRAGLSGYGLDFKRDFGLEGIGQYLGAMGKTTSGIVGDETVKKILSQAVALGLDSSNYSRETEKYFQMTTNFIASSGAVTDQERQKVASLMNSGMTSDLSMAGLQAGGNALNKASDMVSGKGGTFRDFLQASAIFKDKDLKKLSPNSMTALMNLSPEQIMAGGSRIDAMAYESGLDVKEFQNRAIGSVKSSGLDTLGMVSEKYSEFSRLASDLGVSPNISDEQLRSMISSEKDPNRKKLLEKLNILKGQGMMAPGGVGALGANRQDAEAGFLITGQGFTQTNATGVMPKQEMTGFDKAREAQAVSERNLLEKAQEIFNDYGKAAEMGVKATKELQEAIENFVVAVSKNTSDLNEATENLRSQIGKNVRGSR